MKLRKNVREISFECALGRDVLSLRRMRGSEAVSALSKFELEFVSEDTGISVDAMLGTNACVSVRLPQGGRRRFEGVLTRFALTGRQGRFTTYQATMHPALWYLTQASNSRVFQDQSVVDVVKSVFADYPMVNVDMSSLKDAYSQVPYCIQYRESDFAFVSRLLERAHISFFFRDRGDGHTVVLADAYDAHTEAPGYANMLYMPAIDRSLRDSEVVFEWETSGEMRSNGVATLGKADAHGDLGAVHEVRGATRARGLCIGSLFALTGHYRGDQNRDYMVTGADYVLTADMYRSFLADEPEMMLTTHFRAVPVQGEYWLTPRVARPVICGPQTAIVLGQQGETILADKDGFVNVRFSWPGAGKSRHCRECRIRLAHACAGEGRCCHLPLHAGQDVIVDFLDGDPDRPVIIARIPNEHRTPPAV